LFSSLSSNRSNNIEILTEFLIYSNLSITALFSQFLDSRGFSAFQIGVLMAVLPAFSLLANPFWFARSKKRGAPTVLGIITFAASILLWAVYFANNFLATLLSISAVAFFMASLIPIAESIVVPSLRIKRRRFDRVRLFGTIGYGVTALVAGFLIRLGFISIFIMSSAFLISLSFLSKGYSRRDVRAVREEKSDGKLPGLFILMLSGGVISVTIGAFGSTFFPVLTRELGFDVSSAGLGFSLMAFSEIPFLLFADKILSRIGVFRLLVLGMFTTGLRWFLTSIATSYALFMALQSLHGFNYVIVYYSIFKYIHYSLPEGSVIKGQTVYWMSTMGLSYLLGSVVGGVLVDTFGLRRMYTILGASGMAAAAVFFVVLSLYKNTPERNDV